MIIEKICTGKAKIRKIITISVFVSLLLTIINLNAESDLTLFATDNIFNSYSKEADWGIYYHWYEETDSLPLTMYIDASLYLPILNYTLFSVPYSCGLYGSFIDKKALFINYNIYLTGLQ